MLLRILSTNYSAPERQAEELPHHRAQPTRLRFLHRPDGSAAVVERNGKRGGPVGCGIGVSRVCRGRRRYWLARGAGVVRKTGLSGGPPFVLAPTPEEFSLTNKLQVNMYVLLSEPPTAVSSLPRVDQECVARGEMHKEDGTAYALIHGTRPNTISHVLASSPLAILAWIAEKFLDWTEEDPSMELILEVATLYWFTESFPRGIHPYREVAPGPMLLSGGCVANGRDTAWCVHSTTTSEPQKPTGQILSRSDLPTAIRGFRRR